MSELLLTSSLDSIHEGEYFYKPGNPMGRHVTVWQHFSLPGFNEQAFIDDIGDVVEGFLPFEIVGTKDDEFGPNHDVPVRRVKAINGAGLAALHAVTGQIIQRYDGAIRNPEWAYQNYSPHIKYVNGQALNRGEHAKLETLELVRDFPDYGKIVRKVWKFEEA